MVTQINIYICALAVYLMINVLLTLKTRIYREIGAPGQGETS